MSLKIGNEAEDKASSYLQKKGYTILERNFHSKFGEIDIIAQKENVLHFCEVKFSQNYDPITRITSSKMNKIIKTILLSGLILSIPLSICKLILNSESRLPKSRVW